MKQQSIYLNVYEQRQLATENSQVYENQHAQQQKTAIYETCIHDRKEVNQDYNLPTVPISGK